MGCLLVLILGGVSTAMIFFFGYPDWLMYVLGLLWLVSLLFSALRGHMGFGGQGNTDLQIVITGLFIAVLMISPKYAAQKHCDLAKSSLRELAEAEGKYFAGHGTYTDRLNSLSLTQDPNIQIRVNKADGQSFIAAASHNACINENDRMPVVFVWDSSRGGLQ